MLSLALNPTLFLPSPAITPKMLKFYLRAFKTSKNVYFVNAITDFYIYQIMFEIYFLKFYYQVSTLLNTKVFRI